MHQFSETDRLRRRRSVLLLVAFSAITLALALYPSVCTYVDQPQGYWPAYAAAPHAGAEALPALVPPSATEIHTRRDARGGLHWVRFNFAPADHDRMIAGLRRLSLNEARGLRVDAPTFTPWWTVNERTMLGRAGQRLEVYALPSGNAWLFVDPASNSGFYWSRETPR
ncbi:MAG TPA: hypothetical protein VGO40_23095 [Longimicrobium sp.]|jgi:hypothetical protein|nr:hypothetical protein [Longimicrobium sp.]